ncbi:MAG: Ig-like domain-containing protein [Kofleriaceae bacterium]
MFKSFAILLGLVVTSSLAVADGLPSTLTPGSNVVYTVRGHKYALHIPTAAERVAPIAGPAANTHIIFMNPCTGGCTVAPGTTNNQTDKSDIGNGTLSAFSKGPAEWAKVMSCMRNTFARFNVTITDQDPGTAAHLEIMVAGLGSELGQQDGVLGVADYACEQVGQGCSTFHANALVFDFANDPAYYESQYGLFGANDICATAAQEIAHTWALDHVVDNTDPLTYNSYDGIRQYKDAQKCGSDCQSGQSPLNLTCTGSNDKTSTHTCMAGTATQNEVQLITSLFGASAPDTTPPTVSFTSPTENASVMPSFAITANAADDQAIASVDMTLDGTSLGLLTGEPFKWTAPATLPQGPHHLVATAKDLAGNMTMATLDVTYGSVCQHDADCTGANEVCNAGVCVAGPGAQGGLGSPCTGNSDCASGSCGDDGAGNKYCVSGCNPMADTCPTGFSCLATTGDQGVCWPGASNGGGSGGCNTTGNGAAPLFLLGLGAMFLVRRRRR